MSTRVVRVTLTEDRAHVRREGSISLRAGTQEIELAGLSPVLVEKTLRIRWSDPSIRVLDTTTRRQTLRRTEDLPVELAALEAELSKKRGEKSAIENEIARLRARRDALNELQNQSFHELSVDASAGTFDPDQAVSDWHRIAAAQAEVSERLTRLERELVEIDSIAKRIAERKALIPSSHREVATIKLRVLSPTDIEASLVLEYLVPSACWRPYHVARLGEGSVTIVSEACVWQATGEDWDQAELVFSTERPSLGKHPPLLQDDRLSVIRKQNQIQVETREQQIQELGPESGQIAPSGASRPASSRVPGIDDGGEVRRLRALRPASVASDGRPHRFALFEFESACETETVCIPELANVAFRRSVQTNASEYPLLAGPVDLVMRSGLVGRTKLLYVAPNARFELAWGPVPEVRVSRIHDESAEESSMLSSWSTRKSAVSIKLSNLADQAHSLTVVERMPVSEIERVQIQVEASKSTAGSTPDRDGFVRWSVELPAMGRRTLELRYVVKRRSDVVGL